MNRDNCVIFKGTKEGISILLDKETDFATIKEQLEHKLEDAAKFFNGFKTNIVLKGKILTEDEETELLSVISEKTNMNISFFHNEAGTAAETISPVQAILSETIKQENFTKFHKGNVRSGQAIDFDGSVVVIGDVNPGGVIRATGNIIVLGALKGMAHAGCKGLTEAFVAALVMAPVQLRIADKITRFPDTEERRNNVQPEYAYIEDGQIYVVPLC